MPFFSFLTDSVLVRVQKKKISDGRRVAHYDDARVKVAMGVEYVELKDFNSARKQRSKPKFSKNIFRFLDFFSFGCYRYLLYSL